MKNTLKNNYNYISKEAISRGGCCFGVFIKEKGFFMMEDMHMIVFVF
jgi:hypothetical protein